MSLKIVLENSAKKKIGCSLIFIRTTESWLAVLLELNTDGKWGKINFQFDVIKRSTS